MSGVLPDAVPDLPDAVPDLGKILPNIDLPSVVPDFVSELVPIAVQILPHLG